VERLVFVDNLRILAHEIRISKPEIENIFSFFEIA
jgi:hypothetical protein